jgi:hypothetical protein
VEWSNEKIQTQQARLKAREKVIPSDTFFHGKLYASGKIKIHAIKGKIAPRPHEQRFKAWNA